MIQYFCILFILLCGINLRGSFTDDVDFLKQFIQPGDLVFDVGANVGKKTDLYLACGAHVICIDPQPSCIEILTERYKSHSQVTIEPVGVAHIQGTLTFSICNQANTISTFSIEWQQPGCRFADHNCTWDTHIQVPVITLDQLIAKHGLPKFCKIDVENFEYEVLQGLSQKIPYLSFEFAIEILHNTKKCIHHLQNLGYTEFNFAIAEEPLLILSDWVDGDTLIACIEHTAKTNNWDFMWALWGDIYARNI